MTIPTDLPVDRLTASLRATLAGKTADQNAVRQFVAADARTQEQIIKSLASSAVPEELAAAEKALSAAIPRSAAHSQNRVTAEAHFWGYQVFIPESVMKQISQAPSILSAVLGILAPVLVGPLAVVLGIVAGYIAAEFAAMKAVDKGKGVELTATWLAPIILIPSAL